jgi:hypothetical protein
MISGEIMRRLRCTVQNVMGFQSVNESLYLRSVPYVDVMVRQISSFIRELFQIPAGVAVSPEESCP